MGTVKQKFVADNKELVKAYEDAQRQAIKLEERLRSITRAANEAGEKQTSIGAGVKSTAASAFMATQAMVAGWANVGTAIDLVNRSFAEHRRLSQESMRANMSVADSQAAIIKNIGDATDTQTTAFIDRVAAISQKAGFSSLPQMNLAAGDVLSATGGDQERTLKILDQSALLFKDKPEDLAKFSGAVADIMRVTGNDDVKENIGLMLAMQSQARFTNLGAFKEVAPALAAGQTVTPGADRAISTRETAALFAAIGGRIADPEGSRTKTAVANLAANLARIVPEKNTTFERLAMVQADPELQAKALKSGFEGAVKPVIAELLSGPETQTAREVMAAHEKIVGSATMVDTKIRQLEGLTPQLQMKAASERSAGNIEAFQLDSSIGRDAAVRDLVSKTLEQTRPAGEQGAWLTEGVGDWMFDAGAWRGAYGGDSPEAAGMVRLERRIDLIVGRQPQLFGSMVSGEVSKDEFAALDAKAQQQVELLQRQIEILERQEAKYAGMAAGAQGKGLHSE